MWVIENPRLLKTRPFMERLPWWSCKAWQDGRHIRAAQRGPRLMEEQYERVSQSRELLYSVPAALCAQQIARGSLGLGFLQGKCLFFHVFACFFGRCH